jgi:sugar phosphate isomerase/epimerase
MVDWTWFARALARASFTGPISIHLEYEMTGRTAAEIEAQTIESAKRDLAFIRAALTDARR